MDDDLLGDEGADEFDPLSCGAALTLPVIGGGCLARFDPLHLSEEFGADFSAALMPSGIGSHR